MRIAIRFCCLLILLSSCAPLRAALTADNLLLIVNKNEPQGQQLAEYYAQQRHVPDGRIIALDLPKTDDISFDDYETKIVAPLREVITAKNLRDKATCLVLFYGVPLRILQRTNDAQDQAELRIIHDELVMAVATAQPLVEKTEELAKKADPTFVPLPDGQMEPAEALPRRAEFAVQFLVDRIHKMPEGADRDALERQSNVVFKEFRDPVQIDEPTTGPTQAVGAPSTSPILSVPEMAARIRDLSALRWDPAARRDLRQVMRQTGILSFLHLLQAQNEYFLAEDSASAVDNELALLWWNYYPRIHWQPNPLNYKYATVLANPTLMVMRLDAPKPEQVRQIIDTSIKIEGTGLTGTVVLDSQGIPAQKPNGEADNYGMYDQTIRNLNMMLRAHTKLNIVFDDKLAVLPAGSVKGVAVYCGWHSAGHYVASVSFVPGAVAAHIASFEMQTLHNPTLGWCANQINAGAVATFGPVAEPYLITFPLADEFFPLLLTGKLTMAEVYWKTNPLTSWKLVMVGDPLYIPFKVNPPLKVEDLPPKLQRVCNGAGNGTDATAIPAPQ